MFFHLARLVCVFACAITYYTSVQAAANNFTSKPVRIGDTLVSILRSQGFSEREREKVLGSDAKLRSLFLTLDTNYIVRRTPTETELRVFDSQTSAAFFILKKNGAVKAYRFKPEYRVTSERIDGRIYGSIIGSILARVNSNWVATRFTDAYAFDMRNAKTLRRGAPYWFTVEKKYIGPFFIKYGEVTQTSLELKGKTVQKKFVRNDDSGVFFNQGDLAEERPFYAPVNYLKIASRFQPRRFHPITHRLQPHLGVDFELPAGDPVLAARNGIVIRYGSNRAAGNYIVLRHNNGMETAYDHLFKLDPRIRNGLRVNSGDKIGQVGCTGYCTRSHLHFAVKLNGRMVDPLNYIKAYPRSMESILEKRWASN